MSINRSHDKRIQTVWYSSLSQKFASRREEIILNIPTRTGFNTLQPHFLFLQITLECPLHCQMCNMGRIGIDPPNKLLKKDYLTAIDEFAQFESDNSLKLIVFTGGEPFLRKELLYSLVERARIYNIRTTVNTNGTQFDSSDYLRLLKVGPSHIVFSLDSLDPKTTDKLRGRKGFWKMQVQHLKSIMSMKKTLKQKQEMLNNRSIGVNTIVGRFNYLDLPDISTFVLKKLGCDGILFQPLSHTFMGDPHHDPFFEANIQLDSDKLKVIVEQLIAQKHSGMEIDMEEEEIQWLFQYFKDPNHLLSKICDSFNRNIMLSIEGHMTLCSNHQEFFGDVIGKFPEQSLLTMWHSPKVAITRLKMSNCKRNCGMLNCHRKQNLQAIFPNFTKQTHGGK